MLLNPALFVMLERPLTRRQAMSKYKVIPKRLKSRRLNKNAPKAKVHIPKKGKGSFVRRLKKALKEYLSNVKYTVIL